MSKIPEQVKKYFHGAESYNCAQTVFKIFATAFGHNENNITNLKKYGGGKAPNNICGALYAALILLGDDTESKEKITKIFECKAGHTQCTNIRKSRKTPCIKCVEITASVLDDLTYFCSK